MCSAFGRLTREDIIPDWLAEVLRDMQPSSSGVLLTRSIAHKGKYLGFSQTRRGAANVYKPRVVCKECNGRWMSQLENATKPVLTPLVQGQRRGLLPRDQEVIARWLKMKTLFFDLIDPGHRIFTQADFKEFYEERAQQNLSGVWGSWLARYQPAQMTHQALHVRAPIITSRPFDDLPAGSPHAVQMTLVFGHLVLQTVQIAISSRLYPHGYERTEPSPFITRIWPATATVDWPPPNPLTEQQIEPFAAVDTPGSLTAPERPEGTPHFGVIGLDDLSESPESPHRAPPGTSPCQGDRA
jgi:hypothetical protein